MTMMDFMKNHGWARRTGWAVAALVLFWAMTWLVTPPLAKHLIQTVASERLGRAVSVGAVDFKPWSLELTVTDLMVAGREGAPPQLALGRLYLDAELQSLFRLAPVVDALQLERPTVRLTHLGEGRYDIDDVLARFAAPADAPANAPPQFALFNLALTGGTVDFTDQTIRTTHQVRDLTVTVPFLSNLASLREVKVEPRVAFALNGSRFDSAAQATPFAQTRQGDASLTLQRFDLTPYLGYLPPSLPVKLVSGVVDADVRVAFQQTPELAVKLSGQVGLTGFKAVGAQNGELLAFDALQVELTDVRPLARTVKLGAVTLTQPTLTAERDAAGRLNLALAGTGNGPKNATKKEASELDSARAKTQKNPQFSPQTPEQAKNGVSGAGAAATTAASTASAPATGTSATTPWKANVESFNLKGGTVRWQDQTTQPVARLALRDLHLEVSDIAWPLAQPLAFKGGLVVATAGPDGLPPALGQPRRVTPTPTKGAAPRLEKAAASTPAKTRVVPSVASAPRLAGEVTFSGSATDSLARVQVILSKWPLGLVTPYVAGVLRPSLHGQLDADLSVQWQPAGLQLSASRLTLSDAALAEAGGPPAVSWRELLLSDLSVDVAQQNVRLGKLALTRLHASVAREADGQWMYERWRVTPPPGNTPGPASQVAASPPAKPWTVALAELVVSDAGVAYRDSSRAQPVVFDVGGLSVQLKNGVWGPPRPSAKPSTLVVSGRIAAPGSEAGRFSYNGTVALNPLAAQGQVDAVQLPLHAFEPYFGDALNIDLLRADAGFKGAVRYSDALSGPTVRVQGDVALDAVRAVGAATAAASPASAGGTGVAADEDILSWKSLRLRGLDLALAPGTAPQVRLAESTLSDYFARIVVAESGRVNLQNLTKSGSGAASEAAKATPAPAPGAPAAFPAAAPAASASATVSTDTTPPAPGSKPADPLAPVIAVGPVNLLNGQVYFSDRFIKPNYSANLTELTGSLSAFSSTPATGADGQVALADLVLRGKAEGSATLEVTGKLNPLAQPLALDITAKVRDLELPPLSPYAIKYAGYGIERGKLSLDVNYAVSPAGQLTARNQFVLNQLRFGDKVEGAPNSLPVKLAVALLADRNGVIDINLPISGSLNDPQFSIGPIVFKAIVNLIVKAVTSPFSLLSGGAGGAGDDLGSVSFQPGSALLGSAERQSLDKLVRALVDRPSLTLTVVGTASLQAERDALRREQLQQRLLAEKRRTAKPGETVPSVLTNAEYPALVAAVYKRTDMSKPRNALGLAKDLTVSEMEGLLLTNTSVSDDQVRGLANQRASAVREYLLAQKIPADRLFLGASSTTPSASGWRPRAELNLGLP